MHISTAQALPERKHVNTQAREHDIHANTQNTWVHQARDLADWQKKRMHRIWRHKNCAYICNIL